MSKLGKNTVFVLKLFLNREKFDPCKDGVVSKTEAIKARENTIKQLHEKTFVLEYTAREFFDLWLYYI